MANGREKQCPSCLLLTFLQMRCTCKQLNLIRVTEQLSAAEMLELSRTSGKRNSWSGSKMFVMLRMQMKNNRNWINSVNSSAFCFFPFSPALFFVCGIKISNQMQMPLGVELVPQNPGASSDRFLLHLFFSWTNSKCRQDLMQHLRVDCDPVEP